MTLLKADALDLPLVRLETVIGPGDGTTGAGQKRRPSKVGGGPGDVLVPFDEVIPEVGVLDSAPRAPATSGGHFADGSTATA